MVSGCGERGPLHRGGPRPCSVGYTPRTPVVDGVGAARSLVRLMPMRRAMITFCISMVPPGCAPVRLLR